MLTDTTIRKGSTITIDVLPSPVQGRVLSIEKATRDLLIRVEDANGKKYIVTDDRILSIDLY